MKVKAAVIGQMPHRRDRVAEALSSEAFARRILQEIAGNILGVADALARPAEYYVQNADIGPSPNHLYGVEVRATGISREGRTPKQFHNALAKLEQIVDEIIVETRRKGNARDELWQIFVVLMLDGDIETSPGSGKYTSVLEGKAFYAGKREKKE